MKPIVIIAIWEALEQDRKRKRRHWVHPLNTKRISSGQFNCLYATLREYPTRFIQIYRMSVESFDELLTIVKCFITKNDTKFRCAITPEERLAITLRYLSTGMCFKTLSHDFLVGVSTIAGIIKECCKVIWMTLRETEMPCPNEEMWLKIADTFFERTFFPNCIGAVDGKYIRIRAPNLSGSQYFNYKKFFSIVLMAISDADYYFVAIDVGAYGKEADSNVFKQSIMGKKYWKITSIFQEIKLYQIVMDPPQPFVLVGDEAFPLQKNIMRPYPSGNIDREKRIFNYRLSRARRCVECSFGLLCNKWRVLHTAILTEPDFAMEIVKAACIVHNFVLRRRDSYLADLQICHLQTLPRATSTRITTATNNRDFFKRFFL